MARISYIDDKAHPELAEEVGRISGGRGRVLNIYKLLLHAPPVAMSWLEHSNAIRWKTALSPRLRELVVIRIATAARYAYALRQHVPALALKDGVSIEECNALEDWRGSTFFSAEERAALGYADAMFAGPEVPDEAFEAIRGHFSEREIVELTVLIGTYIMHNRVFSALRVDVEP
jgi:alkylhydroperoxidase family enzyme